MRRFPVLFFLWVCCVVPASSVDYSRVIEECAQQYRLMLEKVAPFLSETKCMPRTVENDQLHLCAAEDWTSGFFPGSMWYLHELTGDDFWKEKARVYQRPLLPIQYFSGHHDVGFMMYCSYGHDLRLTGDRSSEAILINTAESLCTRFRAGANTIASWNPRVSRTGKAWECPVIIDNMMNLELLFHASRLSGNLKYRQVAVEHALTTMKNHVRKDYSAFHVVNYDTISGQVTDRDTWQGWSRNSAWARGQAWGIYGFTLCYRETGDKRFLKTAVRMADYYLNHPRLPEDKIPVWDFDVQQAGFVPDVNYTDDLPFLSRDASAGAIVASALIELSGYSKRNSRRYLEAAGEMIEALCDTYRTKPGDASGFLLEQSVGNFPRISEINVPLNYADYYFLEALVRWKKFNQ